MRCVNVLSDWSDAFRQEFTETPYRRVPLREITYEPIDDYDFDVFIIWLDLYTDYLQLLRSIPGDEYGHNSRRNN